MDKRRCPVCNSPESNSDIFIGENINREKISTYTFSSRKEPEWMCYKLVRCLSCELVYAPSTPTIVELANSYHQADFDSDEEANDAADAYIREIKKTLMRLPRKNAALEIGCGTGIFLEHLHQNGFEKIIGIEPSMAAIRKSPILRQQWIRHGIFEECDLEPNTFDLVCCFMTLEHVRSPSLIAKTAYQLLRKGGVFVVVTHDYNSLINKLLGRRSPIIDIEHLQIFNKKSINMLLKNSEFENILIKKFINTYSLKYWLRLAPLPKIVKKYMHLILLRTNLLNLKIGLSVGNIISLGYKT